LHKITELAAEIAWDLKNDYDAWVCVDGDEGDGKSTIGYWLCKKTDPSFTPYRIAYDTKSLLRIIADAPPGSAIMLDEAVELFYSREAMGRDRVSLNKAVMQMRQKNLFFVLCIPNMMDLDGLLKNRRIKVRIHVTRRGWAQFWFNAKRMWQVQPWWTHKFSDSFPVMPEEVHEEYKRLKAEAFEVHQTELEDAQVVTRLYLMAKKEKIKLTQKMLARAFMKSQGRISQYIKDNKDKVTI
jgi:hypothetical protein